MTMIRRLIREPDVRRQFRGMMRKPIPDATYLSLVGPSLPAGAVFARADASSCAEVVGTDGLASVVAAGVPRFSYNSNPFSARGIILERSAQNLVINNGTDIYIKGANWDVTANAIVGPDGVQNVSQLLLKGVNGSNWIGCGTKPSVPSGQKYSFAIDVKRIGANTANRYFCLKYRANTGFTQHHGVFYDFQNDVVATRANGTAVVGSARREFRPNGFVRIYAENVSIDPAYGTLTFESGVSTSSGDVAGSAVGDGTTGFGVDNLQFELTPYSTSPIMNGASALTRAVETLTFPLSGIKGFGLTEGTILVDFQMNGNHVGLENRIIQVDDGTDSNRMTILQDTASDALGCFVAVGGVSQVNSTGTSPALGTSRHIAAFAYKQNDFQLVLDGASIVTDTSGDVPTGLTTLRFGSTGTGRPNATFREVILVPRRMSVGEMQGLTRQ